MERWEKKDQDLYMKAGDNNMKINIGNHEFTELWDGVLYFISTEIFENKDNWLDVEELVNQRGDETTVYLLADGRYMDRINAVYIYDGKDTWTDESGVEWNKAVK